MEVAAGGELIEPDRPSATVDQDIMILLRRPKRLVLIHVQAFHGSLGNSTVQLGNRARSARRLRYRARAE